MSRYLQFAFGIVAYAVFLGVFLYLIAFVGDLPVPRTVDDGPDAPLALALIVDIALIALFGLQHSVMARPGFKARLTRTVPEPAERSVYVMAANLVLILMFWLWRPIPAIVWDVESGWARVLLWAGFFAGWGIVFVSTWLLNHFELFGLHQHWRNLRGQPAPTPVMREPLFYKWVRHPLYAGFILGFWSIPTMTAGHLLLALGITVYILIAIRYEERDLVALLGPPYEDYRRRVGMLVPGLGRARAPMPPPGSPAAR
jgi:methanethiol S-methyltransferase